MDRITATVVDWVSPPASAEQLAFWRLLVAGFVALYVSVRSPVFISLGDRRVSEFDPVGPWFALDAPLSAAAVTSLVVVTGVGALLVAAGMAHRLTGPVFALSTLLLLSYRSSFGQILWFEHLIALHALVVGLSPAADAWTVRRWDAGSNESHERYGHPLRLAALVTVTTYVLAGLAKLRIGGWSWLDGDTLANHIGFSATRLEVFGEAGPPLADAAIRLGPWLAVAAVASVALELGAPVAFFGRRWRRGWVIGVLGMHLGIAATMAVVFPYHVTGIGLVPLLCLRPSTWGWWPGSRQLETAGRQPAIS